MTEKDKSKVANPKHLPKDAQVIISIMKEAGITDYEPRVVSQLLEFTHKYVTTVLEDAKAFSVHAKKKMVDLEDVKLACQLQADKTNAKPPPRDVVMDIARNKNATPLPLLNLHCGLRLPPEAYCLSECNYRLKDSNTLEPLFLSTETTTIEIDTASETDTPPQLSPVLKLSSTGTTKNVDKPEARVPEDYCGQPSGTMDSDDHATMKRKREDDDYDFDE